MKEKKLFYKRPTLRYFSSQTDCACLSGSSASATADCDNGTSVDTSRCGPGTSTV